MRVIALLNRPLRDPISKEDNMKSIAKMLGVGIMGAALAGTAALAQDVNVDFMNTAEMNRIHSYTFGNLSTTNPMLEPRLAIAIDRNLQLNGWKEASDGDVVVTAVLASYSDPRLYEDFYFNLGNLNWNSVGIDPPGYGLQSVNQVAPGTLIIDMYDKRSGELIWRSTGGDFLTGHTDRDKLKIDDIVNRMFVPLPWDPPAVNNDAWIYTH
jgi:hypothetical protein